MDRNDIRHIADLLLEARSDGRRAQLPEREVIKDEEGAYAVQDAVVRSLGTIGGWKVGAASPEATPLCAPLPRSSIRQGRTRMAAGQSRDVAVEAEIAFRIGRDLPPRERPYERQEVEQAIAAAMPAIEIVDSRWQGWPDIPPLLHLADHQANVALICGRETRNWQQLALTRQPVTLTIDGNVVVEQEGGNKAGDLIRLVTWLANHAAARCGGLRQGDVVTTGSCTGVEFASSGSTVMAEFRDLGFADVSLAQTDRI